MQKNSNERERTPLEASGKPQQRHRKKKRGEHHKELTRSKQPSIASQTKRAIAGVLILALAAFFTLAGFSYGGTLGATLFSWLHTFVGTGYALIPVSLALWATALFKDIQEKLSRSKWFGVTLFFTSSLALIDTAAPGKGGYLGSLLSQPLQSLIATPSTVILMFAFMATSLMLLLDSHLRIPAWFTRKGVEEDDFEYADDVTEHTEPLAVEAVQLQHEEKAPDAVEDKEPQKKSKGILAKLTGSESEELQTAIPSFAGKEYNPPPLSLLEKNKGKPSVGDVKANANIIKRTLQNFGIDVEMDEVSIGPSVTRYALKPAEGVRLSRILSLQNNLELALSASPVRIEAPIPGKALVGVEVPNQSRTMLGMGTILANEQFRDPKKPLMIALGSDISGTPHYANLAKMPHCLIAGSTGSGKSVTIHDLIVSLLYRCGPDQLRFVMIDPKRVELTMYNEIPHLLTPVITDAKKAILSLKWLGKEMDRRYGILESEAVRDISSYHTTILAPALKDAQKKRDKNSNGQSDVTDMKLPEPMPYIVAIIDELADLMQTYPRELESSIVRLAQMSRAVGIHLVLSTQRPSVKVITGLIKANVPARIALQVASQIDSRTILDMGGAENLLGAGDMLFLSGEMSKPVRIQAPYISENELKSIVKYLRDEYSDRLPDDISFGFTDTSDGNMGGIPESALTGGMGDDSDDDDLYQDAKQAVLEAGKASTSYLQRKLRVGYSRAARLMDILEQKGVIGPADGAKPREVILGKPGSMNSGQESESLVDNNN
ncbi:MAG: DNA translocase FtsK 4TM domain-containing protein [Minisyncoccia bacterium]